MRVVDRQSVPVPEVLTSEASRQAYQKLVEAVDLDSDEQSRRPPVNYDLVRHPDVLNSLRDLFYSKCAYCETPTSESILDHFRPVSAASDQRERKSSLIHYFWLAYEWNNLYLSCRECNAHKRNRFPIQGRRAPALFSLDEVRIREKALLIDPCVDRPHRSIEFDFNGQCIAKSTTGALSIEIFGLNRQQLVDARAAAFANVIDSAVSNDFAWHEKHLLNPATPYVGALEILTRRVSLLLADHLKLPRPPYRIQVSEFIRMARLVDPDVLFDLLRAPSVSIVAPETASEMKPVHSLAVRRRIDRTISRVEINNFKSIDHLVFNFPELTPNADSSACVMLLADNAAGKTSVLQAIALAVAGAERASRLKLDRARFIRNGDSKRWGQTRKLPPHVRVDFHSGERVEIMLDPFTLEFRGESAFADSIVGYGAHRLLGDRKRRGSWATARIASLFDSHTPVAHPDEWLAAESTDFETVARALAEVLVLQSKDALIRDVQGDVFVQSYGQRTPIDALSDGYQSVIAMSVDTIRWLLQDWPNLETARGIVLIDEIDAHLHPRWKLQIMGALRAAMPQVQFIATTHDPLCLRGMGAGEVVVMKRSFEQRFDLLTDLPDFRNMSAEQILMSDYFGLTTTSDPKAEIGLANLADQFSGPPLTPDTIQKGTREAFDSLMIGDTPQRQVADTAMLEYLRTRRSGTGSQISNGRRRAIDAVLAAIKADDPAK